MRPEPLPRVCTLLTARERTQVEAATDGRLVVVHRSTVSGIYDDIASGHAAGAVISVAMVREVDVGRLSALVRDLTRVPIFGFIGDDGSATAIPGTLVLGRAGIVRIVDARDRAGWAILRESFALELPEAPVRGAVAAVITTIDTEPDGTRAQCRESLRRFFAAVFAPNATTAHCVADELGVMTSTLASRFDRAGLPSPKQYLGNAKLVRAAYIGESPGITIAAISERLQMSSPQSYCRTVRHMTGMTANQFRHAVNGAAALERFTASLIVPFRSILLTFDPLGMRPAGRQRVAAGRAA
jgi:AraC-like DNA-binding protein